MSPAPTSAEQIPWWFDHLAVPILFTLFGAFLGFALGRLNNWLDNRRAKKAFLAAIRAEALLLREHLAGTLRDATENRAKLDSGQKVALHLATAFLTTVYSSQLGKISDLDDPVLIEIVRLYGDLSNLERVKSHLMETSSMLTTLGDDVDPGRLGALGSHYRSTLDEVINRVEKLLSKVDELLPKLPGKN